MKRLVIALALLSGVAPSAAAPAPSAAEQSAWIAASGSDDKDSYKEFIRNFPDGTFASLARIRLEETGDLAPGVTPAGTIPDLVPAGQRYSQRRMIVPASRKNCLDGPDAGCLLSGAVALIDKESDSTSRIGYLLPLAQELAQAGDVRSATKYLQQAASLARALPAADDKASYLANVASSMAAIGNLAGADTLMSEALGVARTVKEGKTEDQSIQDHGRALIDIASHDALLGKVDAARSLFAEAQGLTGRMKFSGYKATLLKEIAEKETSSGLMQDALQTIADYLNLTNDAAQYTSLGALNVTRYFDMGSAAALLVGVGQDNAALTLVRSIGPDHLRAARLLDLRDLLSEKGVHDLSELDAEIRETARAASKLKDAWIYASPLGCALARFGSPAEGTSVARNLFAQTMGNPPYFNQEMFVQCLARHVGADQAADYLMSTRLSTDPKAQREFGYSVNEIVEAYARQGDQKAAREWLAKLPEADRSSETDSMLNALDKPKLDRIETLSLAKRFKEAIAEASRLDRSHDTALGGIVTRAVNAKDLNSALEAARLVNDESSRLGLYASLIELM
jgi:tetratricopeptide (TPR) repeat protein